MSSNNLRTSSFADRAFYDNTCIFNEENMSEVAKTCQLYFKTYEHLIESDFGHKSGITILELGAGTCFLSLLLSNFSFVNDICCVDISLKKMQDLVPFSCRQIASHPEKLRFVEGDFGQTLNFENDSFDLVAFDAALHHSRSIWTTLSECQRVLKPDGLLVCQREAYLGLLSHARKLNDLLKSEEVQKGVSENAYLKKQYEYYLRANGFDPRFLPVAENALQKLLLPLNGLLYSKWVILARKGRR